VIDAMRRSRDWIPLACVITGLVVAGILLVALAAGPSPALIDVSNAIDLPTPRR